MDFVSALGDMGAAVAGLVVILFISLYFYVFKGTRAGDDRKPPVAAGGWPLIGHLHLLRGSSQPPYITLGALADKHGPIFTIRLGVHSAVVVNTWELAKECFTTLDAIVSSRPKATVGEILGHDYANFGFAPYGDFWRVMRKITVSELLSNRRFELLRDIRDSEVRSSLKELYGAWVERRDGSGDLSVDMKQWLGNMNLNAFLRTVAGKRYSDEIADKKEVRRVRGVFREFFRLTGLFVVGDAIPALGWLDLGGHVKDMKRIAKELDNIVNEWLEEHRCKRESSEPKSKPEQDFIDVLLSVLDSVDLSGFDADTVNRATVASIIGAATDTTSVTLTWALSLLLNNPHALKKVQEELDEQVGRERLVNESDIDNLVYVQAAVKETLRLYPPAPLSGAREFTEDCTVGGYHVKAGTRMILNLWQLHRDPRVWEDPLEFKPERFLLSGAHKDVDVRGRHYELLPFGGGRRACPGISFGLQLTHLTLAALLQAFEVTSPCNAKVDMGATFGLTNMKTTPLEILAKPRLSPSLYQ